MNRMDEIITELYEEVKNNYISAWKYDFLLSEEFLSYFTSPESVFADHSKMALGAAHLGYSDTMNKFELAIRDYLYFKWLDEEVNKTDKIDFSALWREVRDRYNANSVDQNLEQLLQEDAEKTSPDEIVSAVIYCASLYSSIFGSLHINTFSIAFSSAAEALFGAVKVRKRKANMPNAMSCLQGIRMKEGGPV